MLNLHTDSMEFDGIEGFVPLFGLAVYRLHVYDVFCDIINELMAVCLENVERMETLDRDAISDEISDLLEGVKKSTEVRRDMTQKLLNNKYARELHSKLKEVIKSWGV